MDKIQKEIKEVIVIENNDCVFEKTDNLQDGFQKFMKLRKDLRKSNKEMTSSNPNWRENPERIQLLREKFIDQAKKYLGVPYSKYWLKEDNPLYNSPLFLDCCGLTRQVVNDLKEDFGFMLGRWNQNYQFDTLPIKIEFNQMKPGDLIFYEATFYPNTTWKPQVHDLVHVEIFLGGKTGEETIAARDRDGVVSIFDTYKFESSNYYDIKFHFRSLDTWLMGIHKSFCNEHTWTDNLIKVNNSKFSIFTENQTNENAEELIVNNNN